MRLKVVNSRSIYGNPHAIVRVDTLAKNDLEWEQVFIEKPYLDGVAVLPVDDKGIYLLNQYRHPIKRAIWQTIMGTLDQDETPVMAALRELREEGGIVRANLSQVGTIYAEPGICSQKTTIYLATNLVFGQTDPDQTEIDIKLKHFLFQEMDEMLQNGEIVCGFTLSTFFLLRNKLIL